MNCSWISVHELHMNCSRTIHEQFMIISLGLVHVPAKFRENTSMPFWVTVRKLNVTDRQTDRRTDRQTDGRRCNISSPGPSAPREIKIIRIIHNKPFGSHTDMLFKLSEILKVTDIYKLQCALFVHDYMHNKLPISFNDSFTKTANPNSRQSSNFFRHRPRTKFSSRLPKHKFPVIWNSLGHDHHSITSRNIF